MKISTLLVTILASQAYAQEKTLNLQGLSIIGDKELPKVLYIVPWETHKATKITAPNYTSSLNDEFTFISKPQKK